MEAAFLTYLVLQLDQWREWLSLTGLVVGLTSAFAILIVYGLIYEFEKRVPTWIIVTPTIVVVLCGLLYAFLPSKKTAEYMAGAYGIQFVVQSDTGQQVITKSGKIVNNVLDLAIQKTAPTPTPTTAK
jgi:H+/Cl- antiporter ClcA